MACNSLLPAPRGEGAYTPPSSRLPHVERGKVEQQPPILDAQGKALRLADVGALRAARFQVDYPIVQRAGDAGAVDDALAQRPAFVRTAVLQREGAVVRGAEHGDAAARGLDHARALARDGVERPDVGPVTHGHSAAMTASGANSCASRPPTRSAQGSFWAKRCENSKR